MPAGGGAGTRDDAMEARSTARARGWVEGRWTTTRGETDDGGGGDRWRGASIARGRESESESAVGASTGGGGDGLGKP